MPDISMCANTKCVKRGACYRYLAIPNRRQSYMVPEPKDCSHFWQIEKGDRVRFYQDVDKFYKKVKEFPDG